MDKKWTAIGVVILCLILFGCGIGVGWQLAKGGLKPQLMYRTEIVEVDVPGPPEVIFVEVEKEVPVEVEVIKEVWQPRLPLKHFDNVTELKYWIEGVILLRFDGDCDDWAYSFQELAYKAGYYCSVQYIVSNHGTAHMRNTVKVGNALYYIEPQYMKFWKATELD